MLFSLHVFTLSFSWFRRELVFIGSFVLKLYQLKQFLWSSAAVKGRSHPGSALQRLLPVPLTAGDVIPADTEWAMPATGYTQRFSSCGHQNQEKLLLLFLSFFLQHGWLKVAKQTKFIASPANHAKFIASQAMQDSPAAWRRLGGRNLIRATPWPGHVATGPVTCSKARSQASLSQPLLIFKCAFPQRSVQLF